MNLFLIGSELRGLETIRGPAWTAAGTTDASGCAVWDYPFVAGLQPLAADVRGDLRRPGLTRNTAGLSNLVAYSADWSDWMGFQHPGANGQWPHLDALWADANIDVVGFDNYLPLSRLDDRRRRPRRHELARTPRPPALGRRRPQTMSGLGLSGPPTLYSLAYLKGNIEGGEKFNWYYDDGVNARPRPRPRTAPT